MNYKYTRTGLLHKQKCNRTLLFTPVRDYYSNSESNKLSYEDLLDEFDKRYGILLDHKYNFTNVSEAIKVFHDLIFHSQFQLTQCFYSKEFVDAFSEILLMTQSYETRKYCLEIVGKLWNFVNDCSTPLTDQNLVESVIHFCGEINQSEAYFAIANYCAISNETRNQAVDLKILGIKYLQHYMKRETVHDHVYSGLRLSLNILLHGVDDIWDYVKPLISKFRFHIQSLNEKNRSLAAKCLILIAQNSQYIEECLLQNVHLKTYQSIINLSYTPHVFDLAVLFIQSEVYDDYITYDFNSYCNSLLDTCDQDMTSFFILLSELMPKINKILYQQGTIDKILEVAINGSFENMKSATFCLIDFMSTVDSQIQIETARNGAFEACCNLVGTGVDSNVNLLVILQTIHDFLKLDSSIFLDIALELDIGSIFSSSEIEDQKCFQQAQLILDFISEQNDDDIDI